MTKRRLCAPFFIAVKARAISSMPLAFRESSVTPKAGAIAWTSFNWGGFVGLAGFNPDSALQSDNTIKRRARRSEGIEANISTASMVLAPRLAVFPAVRSSTGDCRLLQAPGSLPSVRRARRLISTHVHPLLRNSDSRGRPYRRPWGPPP
jgi:hypothetical protein